MNANTWIDLPIVELIEYFTELCATALKWARRYAYLFGIIGIIWSALQVMMSRQQIKKMFWDTFFKWFGFTLLITFYPFLTYGFLQIATEIGEKAGGGKQMVEQNLTKLYKQVKVAQEYRDETPETMTIDIANKTGINLTTVYNVHDSYIKYMEKVKEEIGNVPIFDSSKDRQKAQKIVDEVLAETPENETIAFSGLTLKAIESVCETKTIDSSQHGEDQTDSFVRLKVYLFDRDGNDTAFISPAAMLRLSVLCGMIMKDKWDYEFTLESTEIEDNEWGISEGLKKAAHWLSALPQLIELMFCQFVLIIAIAMCMIQYIMTIIEFTIVTSIAAIFLPLMLFDGTKDIPKKFIPVMISFMMKIIVMLICMYFVMYLLVNHTMSVIAQGWGMNLMSVCEIFFIAALSYVLTQNSPKVAQTILTGQPQLSMGEFVAGAMTGAGTAAFMKQAPHAIHSAGAKTANAGITAAGAIHKSNAASKAAKESLGANASAGKKFIAGTLARTAVASNSLKERIKASHEVAGKETGTGFSMIDKLMQQTGLSKQSGGVGGGSGAGGSGNAYRRTGTTADGNPLNNNSNHSFRTATTNKAGEHRSMTAKEFMDEKGIQGSNVGNKVGNWLNEHSKNKVDSNLNKTSDELPDTFGGERAN